MTDEEELRERERTFLEDRRDQAAWYESLNLYAEAMKIYRAIKDDENIQRLTAKMKEGYSSNARKMERLGKFQEAANLYYLIGDMDGIGRMKKLKPDLVIVYDEEEGGLATIAKRLGTTDSETDSERYFMKPNPSEEGGVTAITRGLVEPDDVGTKKEDDQTPMGRKGVPVKIPIGVKKMRFCPYCGERINTKNDPRFCPFCGDELA
ncbi:MAG: hypothetical protein JXA22_05885 [Candidatus Thermoplasmatota archaeon]|nr:hypothetical protein [Candidatus Thermoplasmatota archaeon]